MANDIAVNLIAHTEGFQREMREAGMVTMGFSKEAMKAQQGLEALAAAERRRSTATKAAAGATAIASKSMGKAQMAATQMTFAVDDAASVYGTSGLAGSVRAAANNLTMVAAIMGGVKAQIAATAVLVGVQLWQAFNKNRGEVDKAADALENFRKKQEQIKSTRITFSVSKDIAGMIREMKDAAAAGDVEQVKSIQDSIKDRARDSREEMRFLMLEIDAINQEMITLKDAGMRAFQGISDDDAKQRTSQLQQQLDGLNRSLREQEALQSNINQRFREGGKAALEQAQQKAEQREFEIREQKRLAEESSKAEQADRARQQQQQEQAERLKQIQDEILANEDPHAAERKRLKEHFDKIADDIMGNDALNQGDRDDLLQRAQSAYERELAKIGESIASKSENLARGPEAVLKGSREALEAVRSQRLASLGLNQKNEVAELQKKGNEHLKNMDKNIASMKQDASNGTRVVVGAFS